MGYGLPRLPSPPPTTDPEGLDRNPTTLNPASLLPSHPIKMKRPIRQISKDGRLSLIAHDVLWQMEKKKKKKVIYHGPWKICL